MLKKILIVSDHNMKRLDSMTESHYSFIKECAKRNIIVEFILPIEPCALVKDFFKESEFKYSVISNWWKANDHSKQNAIRVVPRIVQIIKNGKFDLVEFHFCKEITAILVSLFIRAKRIRPIFIWRQHREIKESTDSMILNNIKNKISLIRILSWYIDLICPVFKQQEKILLRRGISEDKIHTLYNGINLKRFNYEFDEIKFKSDLNIRNKQPVIVTIANLIGIKGINYFILAASLVLKEFPDAKFIIVGEGPLLGELKKLSQELSIAQQVFFLGKRNDVHKILAICDIFVLASLTEAFGISIIEAMASRKPVVASKVGGIPEAVINNESGILVPPKDPEALSKAILFLLHNKDIAIQMGQKGRNIVEDKFSLEKNIPYQCELYGKFLI